MDLVAQDAGHDHCLQILEFDLRRRHQADVNDNMLDSLGRHVTILPGNAWKVVRWFILDLNWRSEAVVPRVAWIDKIQMDVFAQSFQVPVMPFFALFATFTILILAAFSVRFNFLRRTESDVHTPAIGLPSRNIRSESLISEYDPAVVLLLEIIVQRFRIIGSPKPELIDKLLPLPITCEVQKSASLFRRNDVNHILRQQITENLGKAGNGIPFTQFTLRCETRLPRRTRIGALRQSRRGTYQFR